MSDGVWGSYVQAGNLEELETLGSRLNLEIGCPVHYPAFNKPIFECQHNIPFPVFIVKRAFESNDWRSIVERHKETT